MSDLLLPSPPEVFRPGVRDALSSGIVSLTVWLIYLRLVARDFRRATG